MLRTESTKTKKCSITITRLLQHQNTSLIKADYKFSWYDVRSESANRIFKLRPHKTSHKLNAWLPWSDFKMEYVNPLPHMSFLGSSNSVTNKNMNAKLWTN